jgi:4-hydroxybenzoyl-CoA thioesterase
MLLERALGMTKIKYLKAYDFFDHPLVETRARFLLPTRYGDEVTVATTVTECGRSSFTVEHRLAKDGALAVEGTETRVWVKRDPAEPRRLQAQPIPADVVARLTQTSAASA